MATCDFYIDQAAAADGVPYWDTGAPGLGELRDWASRPADPFNDHEPVDSSAAAIAAQGLLRFARVAASRGADATKYEQAGLQVLAPAMADDRVYRGGAALEALLEQQWGGRLLDPDKLDKAVRA